MRCTAGLLGALLAACSAAPGAGDGAPEDAPPLVDAVPLGDARCDRASCGACNHLCEGGDTCESPACTGSRQPVANSTFAVDLASWTAANNPVNAGDALSTFRHNDNGDAENEPSAGPCARVLYQDVWIAPGVVAAAFSAEVRSDHDDPLMPDAVTVIETRPYDGMSDAFRIDLVDPAADVFYAPILYTLFTTVDAVGTPAAAHLVSVDEPALAQLLREYEGALVRLRISQVESNFPWHVDVDNISLTLDIAY